MKVFVTGATGFVGRIVVARLLGEGHQVIAWSRDGKKARAILGAEVGIASPAEHALQDTLAGCDAIVNLQGENLFARRWSATQKERLVKSRVAFTQSLVESMNRMGDSSPRILVSASAVGIYGPRVSDEVDEDSPPGSGFLADLCHQWERAALQATRARVALLRIGVVLGRGGGALAKMLPPFRAGLGGRLGSGRQPMSWIHLADLVSMICKAVTDDRYEGVINATAPSSLTNAEFTKALSKAIGRPALFPVPSTALRLVLGEAASVLLGGQRVVPKRASQLEFKFEFGDIGFALDNLLNDDSVVISRSANEEADFELRQETLVDAPLPEVFTFFSKVENLGAMTPPDLAFQIREPAPRNIEQGTHIEYDIRLGLVSMRWSSRIDRWQPGESFVDTQVRGPYAYWWHEHTFEAHGKQTMMRDTVRYSVPMGPFGRIAHSIFVRTKLRRIFAFRRFFTAMRFHKSTQPTHRAAA